MNKLVISMNGLGDNVYQRGFIQSLVERGYKVWLTTPWPEVYRGLDIGFVKSDTKLRTQSKNQLRQPDSLWSKWPTDAEVLRVSYGSNLSRANIIRLMEECFGVPPAPMSLPPFESPIKGEYVVVRPVTVRSEWANSARNPYPEYIEHASNELAKRGIQRIAVADLKPGKEWIVGNSALGDQCFYAGELGPEQLLGLIRGAKAVVGGVGWILPTCLAYQTPLFCVLGGNGGHNHPSRITDSRLGLSKVRWALPEKMCMCTSMSHKCDKTITNFEWSFSHFLNTL